MRTKITDSLVYKHRYIFGYIFIGLAILCVLLIAWRFVPGGITRDEISTSVTTGSLSFKNFDPSTAVNLPYYLLQRASFKLLGVSILSIKLPSVILGIFSAIGLTMLLRLWFRGSVAIPTTIIAITTPQFIFMAQNGTPMIMFTFLSIWLLLAATIVAWRFKNGFYWAPLLFIAAAALLYTPMGIYLLLTLMTTIIFHPRIRYLVRQVPRMQLLLAVVLGIMFTLPLIYSAIKDHHVILQLLGLPEHAPNILENAQIVLKTWFSFNGDSTSVLVQPVYSLAITLLMIIGLYRLIHVRHTARSYITWVWMFLLVPFIFINPSLLHVAFLLATLLMARGISQILIQWWYKIFPFNPYARIAGLIPVSILVLGIVFSGIYRYMYAYTYNPESSHFFNKDLKLLSSELDKKHYLGTVAILVAERERPFYELINRYNKAFSVTTSTNTPAKTIIATRAGRKQIPEITKTLGEPQSILTSGQYRSADRFYIYKSGK